MEEIQYCEMPDWCTWDDILTCLHDAHSHLALDGIVMKTLSYNSTQLKERFERNSISSKMFVAVKDRTIIATAGASIENGKRWCYSGKIAHLHFDAVLQEYQGMHVFSKLNKLREEWVKKQGCCVIEAITAEKNKHRIEIAVRNGAKLVDFYVPSDSEIYYVYFAKWIDKCPYSDLRIKLHFLLKKMKCKILYKPGHVRRF